VIVLGVVPLEAATPVVERDHSTAAGERIDERGIPVVEVAAKVLQGHERSRIRHAARGAVGVRNAV
jgi:hypothetical protein